MSQFKSSASVVIGASRVNRIQFIEVRSRYTISARQGLILKQLFSLTLIKMWSHFIRIITSYISEIWAAVCDCGIILNFWPTVNKKLNFFYPA